MYISFLEWMGFKEAQTAAPDKDLSKKIATAVASGGVKAGQSVLDQATQIATDQGDIPGTAATLAAKEQLKKVDKFNKGMKKK